MKKTKLKPYVVKVKGAKNYALYDLLNGVFYTVIPDGDPGELKQALLDQGLMFETEGTVPFPVTVDVSGDKRAFRLRELQVRINGARENNCWQRMKTGLPGETMNRERLRVILEALDGIPVDHLRIEAVTDSPGCVGFMLKSFPFQTVDIFVEEGVGPPTREAYRLICRDRKAGLTIMENGKRDAAALTFDARGFFYCRQFNPCLGQQLAVDGDGAVKHCLWASQSLGHVEKEGLREVILAGAVDEYWEKTKDGIEVCKDCELRYACFDCRVGKKGAFMAAEKPSYCSYDPYTGER